MRITLAHTSYEDGHDVTVECKHDDVDINEVASMLRGALVAFGFAQSTVNEILPET